MKEHRSRAAIPRAAAIFVTAIVAVGCGGGGEAPGGDPQLDEAAYDVDAFGYESPWGPGFHPLGTETRILDRDAEIALVVNAPSADFVTGHVREVAASGTSAAAPLDALLDGTQDVLAMARGDVDGELGEELVIAVRAPGIGTRIVVVARAPGGGFVEAGAALLGGNLVVDDIALGDVDGDHVDEIVAVDGRTTCVLDDLAGGLVELARDVAPGSNGWRPSTVVLADLDADGRDEIVAGVSTFEFVGRVLDDAVAGCAVLQSSVTFPSGGFFASSDPVGRLVAADMDGDGGHEIIALQARESVTFGGAGRLHIGRLRWSGALESLGSEEVGFAMGPLGGASDGLVHWDATARFDAADGRDHLAIVLPGATGLPGHRVVDVALDAGGAPALQNAQSYDVSIPASPGFPPSIFAGDVAASGDESAYALIATRDFTGVEFALHRVATSTAPAATEVALQFPQTFVAASGHIAMADFDGDGYVVRSTGGRAQRLADPIPLVLMTAAPTKAGAVQNRGGTETSYREATTNGTSIGVTNQTTVSASVGFGAQIGWFGVQATTEIERSLRTSEVRSESTTVVSGYSAGYDDDVVIFQGTLYESFEYEVISGPEPARVGAYLSIDVPVAAQTYKWTVTKYEDEFPAHAFAPDLLPHTIGDPTSYRSRSELEAIVQGHVGWIAASATVVGQGSGSNSTEVSLESEVTNETELTYTVTGSVGFSTGHLSGSVSVGLSSSEVFSVTTARTTTYAGEVGDMGAEDWDSWHYGFGMAVYTEGVAAPAAEPDRVPVQVITFWTEPNGLGYP